MSETMIDRVAKALFEKVSPEFMWSDATDFMKAETRYFARTVLEAMREPTETMTKAAVDKALSVSLSHEYRWPDYMRDLHRIQIDAALSPAGEK